MPLTLLTMAQGNPVALKRTMDSLNGVINEVIFGDVLIFDEDRKIIEGYQESYNLKMIRLPFNYIFNFGFSSVLNILANKASNDMVLYLNVSEIVEGEHRILELINYYSQYNNFAFDHATDPHSWFRTYNRHELQWSGVIHEDLEGTKRRAPFYLFRMADTEKDMSNPFKAKVMDDVKEIVYFNNYLKLADNPELLGASGPGWVQFAKDNAASMAHRLFDKGLRYEAFKQGDLKKYLEAVHNSPQFQEEIFHSSLLIEYQNDPKFLGK